MREEADISAAVEGRRGMLIDGIVDHGVFVVGNHNAVIDSCWVDVETCVRCVWVHMYYKN